MENDTFFKDSEYIGCNETIKMLINGLMDIFEDKCLYSFKPKWRGRDSGKKVFVLKLDGMIDSRFGRKRGNIITVRLAANHLEVEVFKGKYYIDKFLYRASTSEMEMLDLYRDINDLFVNDVISV